MKSFIIILMFKYRKKNFKWKNFINPNNEQFVLERMVFNQPVSDQLFFSVKINHLRNSEAEIYVLFV